MTQDVEMKDSPATSNSSAPPPSPVLTHLKNVANLIEKGVVSKEVRLMIRAIRHVMTLRRKLKAPILLSFLKHLLPPGSEAASRLLPYFSKEDEKDMEVDSPSTISQIVPTKYTFLAELEIFSYLLVLIFLIDQKQYNEAKTCSSAAISRLKQLNRRTLDVLAARLYFYYSYSYELTDSLVEIRGTLLALHRTATLRHDELGQETLLNLLLRNYLHYNLYDQAEKLRSKAPRFEPTQTNSFVDICIIWGELELYSWSIQMQKKVSCKQLGRLLPLLVVFAFSATNGLQLFACFLVKYQRGLLSCRMA